MGKESRGKEGMREVERLRVEGKRCLGLKMGAGLVTLRKR